MPFKSLAQSRLIAMKESKGELPQGTYDHWMASTPNFHKLPEHVKKASDQDGHGVWNCDQCGKYIRSCKCLSSNHCSDHKHTETCQDCRDDHITKEAAVPGPIKNLRRMLIAKHDGERLFHTTSMNSVIPILESGSLKPSPLHRNRGVYFGVGAPAREYKPHGGRLASFMLHGKTDEVIESNALRSAGERYGITNSEVPIHNKSTLILPQGISRKDIPRNSIAGKSIERLRMRVVENDQFNKAFGHNPGPAPAMHVDGSKRAFAKTASEHDHKDAWVANVIAPYKSGWIASLRPIDKRKKPGDFGTVGGKLDEGETALQAAKREANEEGWAIKGIHKKPIHIADSPKGKIVTFAASGASKLYGHKERDREVHQITVSIDELANSHTHNSFLKHVDPKNHKAFIGMNKKADAAGGEATQNIGADNVGIEPPPPPQTDQAMAHTTGQAAQQNIAMKHMSQQRKPQLPPRRIPHNWVPR